MLRLSGLPSKSSLLKLKYTPGRAGCATGTSVCIKNLLRALGLQTRALDGRLEATQSCGSTSSQRGRAAAASLPEKAFRSGQKTDNRRDGPPFLASSALVACAGWHLVCRPRCLPACTLRVQEKQITKEHKRKRQVLIFVHKARGDRTLSNETTKHGISSPDGRRANAKAMSRARNSLGGPFPVIS